MSTIKEECSSVISANITNEKMLDYIVYGHNTKDNDTGVASTQDTRYCTTTDDYNTTTTTVCQNDSGSNESLMHDNDSYIPETAAFCNDLENTKSCVVQKEPYIDYTVTHLVPMQTINASLVSNGYITLDEGHIQNAINTEHETNLLDNTTPNQLQTSSPVEAPIEVTSKSWPVLEDDFPYTTAEIYSALDSCSTLIKEEYENGNSPAVSEGDYLPYNTAIIQHNSSAINTPGEDHQQNNSSMKSTEQVSSITDCFPYVTLNDDNFSSTKPPAYPFTNDRNNIDVNPCDADYITDTLPHSVSCSDINISTMMKSHQGKYVNPNNDAGQQIVQHNMISQADNQKPSESQDN